MKKFLRLSTPITMLVLAVTVFFTSCKKNFDQPPFQTDPAIVANTSIKTLRAMHTGAGVYDVISTNIIISGTVVADDRSGNLYKQLFIQDSTGGLQILLDATNLYGTYPVGRKIFINCNGLCISDYNGTMELGVKALVAGAPSLEGIPGTLISKYVTGGTLNNPVVPKVVTLAQLTTGLQDQYLGSLIQLDGYEFSDTSKTYSDTSVYKSTVNLTIKNCAGTSTIVRTSAYANFAGYKVAKGNGSIIAIYTTFGTTKQLLIRDTSDVKFNGPRCGSTPTPPPAGAITILAVRALPQNTTFTSGSFVGKVISNNTNEASGNYRIQDDSGAGVILFTATGSPVYPLGTVLNVNLAGGKLAPYQGDLELSGVPISGVSISTATPNPVPVVRTIAQINANINTIASTLVKINNITSIVTGTSNSTGVNYTVNDATGSIALFVRVASGITVNTSGTSLTGYVSLFNTTPQVGIRSASDIQ